MKIVMMCMAARVGSLQNTVSLSRRWYSV